MLDVGIKETTTTTGTGTVTLSAVSNFVRVSDAFAVGSLVGYCLISGNGDKEWGVGVVGAGNTMSRNIISATLVGSTFTKGGAAISLTGTSTLICTENGAASASGAVHVKNPSIANARFCPYMVSSASLTTFAMTANRVIYVPFSMQSAIGSFVQLSIDVSTLIAGSSVDVGVYDSKLLSGGFVPGVLFGSVNLDSSTTGIKSDAISFTPRPGGVYWLACRSSLAPTIRGITASGGQSNLLGFASTGTNPVFYLYSSGGSLPSDASGETFTTVASGAVPAIFLRH